MPEKYVVIYETDMGYMDCIAICDTAEEAYGEAYLALCDDLDEQAHYITLAENREGDNGMIMEVRAKADDKIWAWCTILFKYRRDEK